MLLLLLQFSPLVKIIEKDKTYVVVIKEGEQENELNQEIRNYSACYCERTRKKNDILCHGLVM